MNISDVEGQVIIQRLSRPKFFDQVFSNTFVSSERISVISLGTIKTPNGNEKQSFAALVRPGVGTGSYIRKGRRGRYDTQNEAARLIRQRDSSLQYDKIQVFILNHIQKDGFHKETHQPIIEAALAANPKAIQNCMNGGKFQRSASVLSEKERIRKRISELQREVRELKKVAVVDSWNLRHISNAAGKYVAETIATELKAKFGHKLEDIELKFSYPEVGDTAGETMKNCLSFFKEAFGNVDQNALFTFLARSQDEDYRRWCALAAPKEFLLSLLMDTDAHVREGAKLNREGTLLPLLDRLHNLEIELKRLDNV